MKRYLLLLNIILLSGFSVFAQTGSIQVTLLNVDIENPDTHFVFPTPVLYGTVTVSGNNYQKTVSLNQDCAFILKNVPCGEITVKVQQQRNSHHTKAVEGKTVVHPGTNAMYIICESDGPQVSYHNDVEYVADPVKAQEPAVSHIGNYTVYTSVYFDFAKIKPNEYALDALEKMKGVKIDNDRIIVDNSNFRTSWNDNIWTAWLEE